jgi:hypothetical protein
MKHIRPFMMFVLALALGPIALAQDPATDVGKGAKDGAKLQGRQPRMRVAAQNQLRKTPGAPRTKLRTSPRVLARLQAKTLGRVSRPRARAPRT